MSKYTEAKTAITCKDNEFLVEALKRIWKDMLGKDLQDSDIEFHDEAVPLLGYQGDVRDKNSNYPQYANVIIRGDGLDRASADAKKKAGWDGKSRNRMRGVDNDWGLRLGDDGFYDATVTTYDSSTFVKIADMMRVTVTALKLEKNLEAIFKERPDAVLTINGIEFKRPELTDAVNSAMKSGKVPIIKIKYGAGPGPLGPPREATFTKKPKGGGGSGGGRRRDRDRSRGREI